LEKLVINYKEVIISNKIPRLCHELESYLLSDREVNSVAFLGKKIARDYGVHCDKNILIPVRDGVTLAADVYRPASPDQFPAILQMYPYRKDDRSIDGWRV